MSYIGTYISIERKKKKKKISTALKIKKKKIKTASIKDSTVGKQ